LHPNECLVLEDNAHGIIAATESGAHVLKINHLKENNIENILRNIQQIENQI
jgi:beta-phosphoglucomutase-like phosphatase (HAD superfamily)